MSQKPLTAMTVATSLLAACTPYVAPNTVQNTDGNGPTVQGRPELVYVETICTGENASITLWKNGPAGDMKKATLIGNGSATENVNWEDPRERATLKASSQRICAMVQPLDHHHHHHH